MPLRKADRLEDQFLDHHRICQLPRLWGQQPFLTGCQQLFIDKLVSLVQPRLLAPEKVLATEGERGHELFMLQEGCVVAMLNHQKVEDFPVGTVIGDAMMMYSQWQWPYNVVTATRCQIQYLSCRSFRSAISAHPSEGKKVWNNLRLGPFAEACSGKRKLSTGLDQSLRI